MTAVSAGSAGLVASLRNLDACAVCDACDRLGVDGCVVTGIVPLTGPARVVGRAVTVRLGPPQSDAGVPQHLCAGGVDEATEDDVIVIDHQGRLDCAGWGGLLSRAAQRRGCAGTLVDGAARDIDEAIDIEYPVFAAGTTPRTARGRAVEIGWGEPIIFRGTSVRTGDYVIADSTGIVIIPAKYAASVVRAAESISAIEAAMAADVAKGISVAAVMGKKYESMLASADVQR